MLKRGYLWYHKYFSQCCVTLGKSYNPSEPVFLFVNGNKSSSFVEWMMFHVILLIQTKHYTHEACQFIEDNS